MENSIVWKITILPGQASKTDCTKIEQYGLVIMNTRMKQEIHVDSPDRRRSPVEELRLQLHSHPWASRSKPKILSRIE